ncbi:MAG: molybdopterin synthase sulfur carrier subunit [Desulfovibrio sp. S3730MH75]|nr:MAG: molybdopterin synthase sulfur carrier subunit [Desulfovibrio sp. S3730MH75]
MNIQILCYATFAERSPDNAKNFPISEGETVKDVVEKVGIPVDEVKIVFINGVSAILDAKLADGDRVGVFPAVGGG